MLYVDAIRVLEKVARARFDLASMPKKEEIEEAIPIVAGMRSASMIRTRRSYGTPGVFLFCRTAHESPFSRNPVNANCCNI